MIDKNQARLRRARKTRAKIAELKSVRLSVHRTNCHIYAQVISACGSKVLAAASTLETEDNTIGLLRIWTGKPFFELFSAEPRLLSVPRRQVPQSEASIRPSGRCRPRNHFRRIPE